MLKRKKAFLLYMTSCSNTNIFGKWVSEGYILSESENGHTTGEKSHITCDIGLFAFLAQPIFQLRYWAVSPLQRPKNDDPTRVKGENKCKSTGWTVKSRPHQIVEFQTFFILVLIKCYSSFLILVSFICPSGTFGCEAFIYTYFPLNVLLCLWLPKSFVNADQNSPRIPMPSAYIILTDWVKMMLIRILQEFLCHQLTSF